MSAKNPASSTSLWRPLAKYVPENSFDYVVDLLNRHTIFMKVTKPKKSRAGLYFFDEKNGRHAIYINGNMDKLNFLITLIHEYAHLVARVRYGRSIKPHGKEWKQSFQELMRPLIDPAIFPEEVLKCVKNHMNNPAASHFRDKDLMNAISRHCSRNSSPVKSSISASDT
ncbi:MAG: SprT-like domain-containing protein [Thermaurantimonas sp.]